MCVLVIDEWMLPILYSVFFKKNCCQMFVFSILHCCTVDLFALCTAVVWQFMPYWYIQSFGSSNCRKGKERKMYLVQFRLRKQQRMAATTQNSSNIIFNEITMCIWSSGMYNRWLTWFHFVLLWKLYWKKYLVLYRVHEEKMTGI